MLCIRFLFYIENACDQLHGGIVRMILIFRIKQAQFFQVFKLIDLIAGWQFIENPVL